VVGPADNVWDRDRRLAQFALDRQEVHVVKDDQVCPRSASVVGASAGAPSAMQFALRHLERARALGLLVPAGYPTQIERRPGEAIPKNSPAREILVRPGPQIRLSVLGDTGDAPGP
jgi:pimeloyl-ACP methyl ester carboxylesterase